MPPSQTEIFGAIPDWTVLKFDTAVGFKQNFSPSSYYVKVVYDSLKYQCLKESLDLESFKAMVKENYGQPSASKDSNSFNSFFISQFDLFESTFINQLNKHSTLFAFYKFAPEKLFLTNSQIIIVYPKKLNRFVCGKKIRDDYVSTLDAEIYFMGPQSFDSNRKYNVKFSLKDELGVMAYKGPYNKLLDFEGLTNFYGSEDYWGPMREAFSALGKKLGRIIRAYNEKGKWPKENPVRYESNNFR